MPPIKVLILENDSSFVSILKINLSKWARFDFFVFKETDGAYKFLENNQVDLIITKPTLSEKYDGVNLGKKMSSNSCPLVFIAELGDNDSYEKVSKLNILSFLIKPFDFKTLFAALNLYFDSKENFLIINKGKEKIRILYTDIYWIRSAGNYSVIRSGKREYAMKISLKKLMNSFLDKNFIQVHRAFIIRIDKIEGINVKIGVVNINDTQIPIGRKYRKEFFDRIDVI